MGLRAAFCWTCSPTTVSRPLRPLKTLGWFWFVVPSIDASFLLFPCLARSAQRVALQTLAQPSAQEIVDGKSVVCGGLAFDSSGQELTTRLANAVYEKARSQALPLPGFPDYEPLLHSLRAGDVVERTKSFRVSAQRHDRLLVLETYAKKWYEDQDFTTQVKEMIEAHNREYNPEGDFWMGDAKSLEETIETS